MPIEKARDVLERIVFENRKAHFRFESADCSLIAKIDGFIGRNAMGALLIVSNLNGICKSFELKIEQDFDCDYTDVSSIFPDSPEAIRVRFTNGDILLVTGARDAIENVPSTRA